jgi:2-hydroxychromene-2-carboxylate isomerase
LAARVVLAGEDAGWVPAFVRNVYRANFGEDRDIADRAVLESILRDVGTDPAAVLRDAESQPVKDHLRASTEQAQRLGIFGAPSYIVRGELFWGNDRLEDALTWARQDA